MLIRGDHQPLRCLMSLKTPAGRLAKWALQLQGYNLKIEYTPAKSNRVADHAEMIEVSFLQKNAKAL